MHGNDIEYAINITAGTLQSGWNNAHERGKGKLVEE